MLRHAVDLPWLGRHKSFSPRAEVGWNSKRGDCFFNESWVMKMFERFDLRVVHVLKGGWPGLPGRVGPGHVDWQVDHVVVEKR